MIIIKYEYILEFIGVLDWNPWKHTTVNKSFVLYVARSPWNDHKSKGIKKLFSSPRKGGDATTCQTSRSVPTQ